MIEINDSYVDELTKQFDKYTEENRRNPKRIVMNKHTRDSIIEFFVTAAGLDLCSLRDLPKSEIESVDILDTPVKLDDTHADGVITFQ